MDYDDEAKPETDGKVVEVWLLQEMVEDDKMILEFAAKFDEATYPHAQGQWLICERQWHEKSSNPKWKGFQKIYRKKYKPTKFLYQHSVTLNSSNETDSEFDNWGHCQEVLNLVCEREVMVVHKRRKKKGARGRK